MPEGPALDGGTGSRLRRFGPLLLVGAMVATGLVAAYTVTPQPDPDSLARPEAADLVIAGSIPASWDPAAISDAASAQTLAQVYDGLTVLDAQDQLRPALAASWTVADEGLSATFHLRPDLRFSDGSPIGDREHHGVERGVTAVSARDPANRDRRGVLPDGCRGDAQAFRPGPGMN